MIIQKPVPNYTQGRGGYKPEGIVIHVGEGSQSVIYNTFMSEEKSSHYCVSKTGEIWQFVQDNDTAWAQGKVLNPSKKLITSRPNVNPNQYLLSIEHEGYGTNDFTDAQYAATANLIKSLCQTYAIPVDREHIIRHNEVRSDKPCPGVANVDKLVSMAGASGDKVSQAVDLLKKALALLS